ncbi:E3 ubiquitin-protein ligase TRIM11-like [Poecilia latipinna]|uniref:E3 ubiquitin-protein ligase TRIM11-like n=1 Tax=Poecilia latipinna TaxID=48699 RepID=UPI00072E9284|nr:PREDICTED: E3 ubiquitin-protein ligase TRIM11-like [Poecilia latipinna]
MSPPASDLLTVVDQQSSEVPSDPSAQQTHQIEMDSIFVLLEENIVTFVKNELKKIQKVLSPDYPECSKSLRDDDEVLKGDNEEQRRSSREALMKITLNFLRRMKQEDLADRLQKIFTGVCQRQLKSGLKKKFQSVFEGIAKAGSPTLLNQIYTELYITEGGTGEVNDEHESPNCNLETLSVSGCLVSEEGCASLASALTSNPSHLKELDLSYNHPGDSGVKLLSAGLKDPDWRLEALRVEPAGGRFLTPGLRKYSCQLTIDTNTVSRELQLSEDNRKVTHVKELQSYPDHPDRFDYHPQLLCRTGLTGRCYWEVEWRGRVELSVSYRRIRRKVNSEDCLFGLNDYSWSLICSDEFGFFVRHCNIETPLSSSVSNRVAVYVDDPAGILSFYRVSSDSLIHLHTFNTTFTEPLLPGFGFWWTSSGSSMFLC